MANISDANTADFDRWGGRPPWASRDRRGPGRGDFGPRDVPPFGRWHRGSHLGHIILVVAGFMIWWPLGLAALALTFWRTKMGCWNHHGHHGRFADRMERMQWKMDRMRGYMEGRGFYGPSSGNRAFDDYRMETLRRLEEEQKEFREFLDRLRHARDKEEFDAFMAQHRTKPSAPDDQPQG
ncbi:MAG: DUF2852 domain-containing protein [Bradyrhizobiaceae bacterium]|nr:MAG: DUF2852 domain-containing protein [Bradyrhizobiaceae bacterium]